MRGKPHSNTVRAQAMTALLIGDPVLTVAAAYGLPKQTVSDWRKRLIAGEFDKVRTKKREDGSSAAPGFDALLFDYLEATLGSMTVQVQEFGNLDWLKEQNARELALLHGILFDRTFRMLEIYQSAAWLHP
jgi:hypothetical protein